MIKKREAEKRGVFKTNHSLTELSFSFGSYFDPLWMGFRDLRVLNEYTLYPKSFFDDSRFKNIEVITFVIDGVLEFKDSLNHHYTLSSEEAQVLSPGNNYEYSLYNSSDKNEVRFIQFWLAPRGFLAKNKVEKLVLPKKTNTISPLSLCEKNKNELSEYALVSYGEMLKKQKINIDPTKSYWLQILEGEGTCSNLNFGTGDGFLVEMEKSISLESSKGCKCILVEFQNS